MKPSPYITGNSVGGSPAFVGRADILREVKRIIQHPNQNVIALYGQRRIGKTSILKHLEMTFNAEGTYHAVYFDLLGRAYQPLNTVLAELARKIKAQINSLPTPPSIQNSEEFHTWLFEGLKQQKPLILLLDEFEVLENVQAQGSPDNFFNYLHDHLINQNNTKFNLIFAVGRNISDLQNVALAVFKSIPTKHISLLNETDTTVLIRLSESEKDQSLFWADEAVNAVWQWTQGHPFLTQLLCQKVWDHFIEQNKTQKVMAADVEANLEATLEAAEAALLWLWKGLPPNEKIVSAAIASFTEEEVAHEKLQAKLNQVAAVVDKLSETLDRLVKWDLLQTKKENNIFSFKVKLIQRWVRETQLLDKVIKEIDRPILSAENFYNSACFEDQAGRYGTAVFYLQEALKLTPAHIEANILCAKILYKQNQIDAAIHILRMFYNSSPESARVPLVELLIGKIHSEKDLSKKIEIIREVYSINPEIIQTDIAMQGLLDISVTELCQLNQFDKAIHLYIEFGLIEKAAEISHRYKDAVEFSTFAGSILVEIEEISDLFVYDIEKDKIYTNSLEFSKVFSVIAVEILQFNDLMQSLPCGFIFGNSCLYLKKESNFLCGWGSSKDIPLGLLQLKVTKNLMSGILAELARIRG